MSLVDNIARMITPSIEAMGFELVRVQVSGNQRRIVQIMAEPQDGRQMSVDDCADLSRAISAVLDVEDPITDGYSLEVSSPGIDRPLTRLMDFARWAGHEAKIELNTPVRNADDDQDRGRRRFRGTLLGLDGQDVVIRADNAEVKFPFRAVANAKLVLTDKLINEDLKARKSVETLGD